MKFISLSKTVSITNTIAAMIREANKTTTALLDNSVLEGHETLCTSSLYESLKYAIIFFIKFIIYARKERLELPTAGFGDRYSTN